MKTQALAVSLTLALAGASAAAQTLSEPYRPLFTPQMIQRASPDQAARMRATEQLNRKSWEQRQARLQQEAAAAKEAQEAPEPQPRRARGSKIYKWVDKDGRVHFGDSPDGQGASEVQVGGAARVEGTPLPTPSLDRD